MSFFKKLIELLNTFLNTEVKSPEAQPVEVKPAAPKPQAPPPRPLTNTVVVGSLQYYADNYQKMTLSQDADHQSSLAYMLEKLLQNKTRYEAVSSLTGVPWALIGAIHGMEATFDFSGCLQNGEKIIGLDKKTTLVPKGRGPFKTWEDSAIDSLNYDGLSGIKLWVTPLMLEKAETYNGLGYLHRGVMSPYVWGGTSLYTKGHYVQDGVFDPEAVSKRSGVAAMFKALEQRGISLL